VRTDFAPAMRSSNAMNSPALADWSVPSAPRQAIPRASDFNPGRTGLPLRAFALGGAVLLHVLALLWVTQFEAPAPVEHVMLLQASLIAPAPVPEPAHEAPRIEPLPVPEPKQPIPRREAPTQPRLTATENVPAAFSVPPQDTSPAEPTPIDTTVSSTPSPGAAPARNEADNPADAVPQTPPTFDAAYLSNPKPAYPSMSRRLGEEGRVTLWVMVEADGLPSKVEVRTGSGHARLDQAAVDAVRNWKFVPARRGSEPVSASVIVPMSFTLPR
jgi:protein TonB